MEAGFHGFTLHNVFLGYGRPTDLKRHEGVKEIVETRSLEFVDSHGGFMERDVDKDMR